MLKHKPEGPCDCHVCAEVGAVEDLMAKLDKAIDGFNGTVILNALSTVTGVVIHRMVGANKNNSIALARDFGASIMFNLGRASMVEDGGGDAADDARDALATVVTQGNG